MDQKSKITEKNEAISKTSVLASLISMRTFKRRTVVWPAILVVNEFEFKCMLYDISLGGVRLKLDLPLATGTLVHIKIKNFDYTDALVAWHADAFVGLEFVEGQEYMKEFFGDYAQKLL